MHHLTSLKTVIVNGNAGCWRSTLEWMKLWTVRTTLPVGGVRQVHMFGREFVFENNRFRVIKTFNPDLVIDSDYYAYLYKQSSSLRYRSSEYRNIDKKTVLQHSKKSNNLTRQHVRTFSHCSSQNWNRIVDFAVKGTNANTLANTTTRSTCCRHAPFSSLYYFGQGLVQRGLNYNLSPRICQQDLSRSSAQALLQVSGQTLSGFNDGDHQRFSYQSVPSVENQSAFELPLLVLPFLHRGCKTGMNVSRQILSPNHKVFHTQRVVPVRSYSTPHKPAFNPVKDLQQYVSVPLIGEYGKLFDPAPHDVGPAQQLFLPNEGHEIKFLQSAVYSDQLPEHDMPEVGFVGRSNVGKSSLISALFTAAPEVKVKMSKKPGQTKTLNFFTVGKEFSLVDMPGYGFNMPKHYQTSVETYLKSRKKLCRSFVIIDGNIGIQTADHIGLDMMEEFRKPYVIVLTKIDRVPRSRLVKNLVSTVEYIQKYHFCFPQPFLCSSVTGDGIALLQTFIAYITGNVKVEGH